MTTSNVTKLQLVQSDSFEKEESVGERLAVLRKQEINGVTRLKAPGDKTREITQEMASLVRQKVHEYATELAEEAGLSVSMVISEFSNEKSLEQDVILKFSASTSLGLDRLASNLIKHGRRFKVPPECYGVEFVHQGVEYVIDGLDTTDEKEPLIRMRAATESGESVQKLTKANSIVKLLRKRQLI